MKIGEVNMLKDNLQWLTCAEDLTVELLQSRDEGKDITGFEERVKQIKAMNSDDPQREIKAAEILDEMTALPVKSDFPYDEPTDLVGIMKARTADQYLLLNSLPLQFEILYDQIYGAWLGRCVGCLLGQPIEGWHKERIHGLLQESHNYPIRFYISSELPEGLRQKYNILDQAKVYGGRLKNWINNVRYAPEDDDTNYTIIGLKILEEYGPDFSSEDVAESWLANLPVLHLCTAERVAYRNLLNLIPPPSAASFRNPYREWIGAQIRADIFGYIAPGNPELAAQLAWRDASISHVKNGIYGEMFVAAMLAAAAVSADITEIIHHGLAQIPTRSRLTAAINEVFSWKENGLTWEQAIEIVHQKYDEKNPYDWCHTIPNAMIVCLGLLYGELDFGKSVGIAVMSAFDTDCNGATVGSIMGMILGAKALPEKWITPLNNQLKSGVDGFGLELISNLAKRTQGLLYI
jgi:ADP-ribosylglycohydrolase